MGEGNPRAHGAPRPREPELRVAGAPFAPAAILTHYRWDRESRPSISRHRQRHARATRYFDFHTFIANDTITRQSELALCPDSRIKVITTFAFYIYKAAAL